MAYAPEEFLIGFDAKDGQLNRMWMDPTALASFFGALIETNTSDLTINQFSYSNGRSPSPSTSHINGKNGDLRYLRTDYSGGKVNVWDAEFDKTRNEAFANALYKFGWEGMLSHRYNNYLLPHTTHYTKSPHYHHLHLGGYNLVQPKTYGDTRMYQCGSATLYPSSFHQFNGGLINFIGN